MLPIEIQQDFRVRLHEVNPTEKGKFKLKAIRKTKPKTYEEQRIVVLVVDENGFPMPSIDVAFAYDTADFFVLGQDFKWTPPLQQAFIAPTHGSGEIDQIQGSAVKPGEPGGVTVFVLHPEYSSDYVSGCGMLADHTGLHLTFQRVGKKSFEERISDLEEIVFGG